MVKDLGVVNRLDIIAVICNGCICCTKLYVGNTVGQTAKCCRKVGICKHIAVGICVSLCAMGKSGETKVIQIFQTKLRGNILETLDCNGIDRITDRGADGSGTIEGTAGVVDRSAIFISDRLILISGSQSHALLIQSRCISGYDLESRSRLTGTVCSTVQRQAGCLLTASSDDRFHISGMLVNDGHC